MRYSGNGKARWATIVAGSLVLLASLPAPGRAADANPCLDPTLEPLLLCPDLAMSRPFGIYLDRKSIKGRQLLRAANSINSIGDGPAEVRGTRSGPRTMTAVQRIYKVSGNVLTVNTGARLRFKRALRHGTFWKFDNAARFELWRLDDLGVRTERVRTGPKLIYCLRDLSRTRGGLPGSPPRRAYPACSQDRRKRSVTLGTSVGWSDIYPASYNEQWIDVTGLRGCFTYVMTSDPLNHIYERDEQNNSAETAVRLPFKRGQQNCKILPTNASTPEQLPTKLPKVGY